MAPTIAIVGAGLGGLLLALSLFQGLQLAGVLA